MTAEFDREHGYHEITCGIYGSMVHTTFASSYPEADEKCEAIKRELEEFARSYGEEGFDSTSWVEAFVDRW